MHVACIYHNADLDGKCSAAIVRSVYPDAVLIGRNYGDKDALVIPPGVTDIFVVDFSLPWNQMEDLANRYTLNWIDHHANKIRESEQRGYHCGGLQVLNPHFAACELVWGLLRSSPAPDAVTLLGLYDSWRGRGDRDWESRIMPFQCAMQAMDWAPGDAAWQWLFGTTASRIEDMITRGLLVYQDRRMQYARAAEHGHEVDMLGLRFLAVNTQMSGELVGLGKYDPDLHDAVLSYYWDGRLGEWKVSMRSKDADVSVVAIHYGGNGHRGAAGFVCTRLPWEDAR